MKWHHRPTLDLLRWVAIGKAVPPAPPAGGRGTRAAPIFRSCTSPMMPGMSKPPPPGSRDVHRYLAALRCWRSGFLTHLGIAGVPQPNGAAGLQRVSLRPETSNACAY